MQNGSSMEVMGVGLLAYGCGNQVKVETDEGTAEVSSQTISVETPTGEAVNVDLSTGSVSAEGSNGETVQVNVDGGQINTPPMESLPPMQPAVEPQGGVVVPPPMQPAVEPQGGVVIPPPFPTGEMVPPMPSEMPVAPAGEMIPVAPDMSGAMEPEALQPATGTESAPVPQP